MKRRGVQGFRLALNTLAQAGKDRFGFGTKLRKVGNNGLAVPLAQKRPPVGLQDFQGRKAVFECLLPRGRQRLAPEIFQYGCFDRQVLADQRRQSERDERNDPEADAFDGEDMEADELA